MLRIELHIHHQKKAAWDALLVQAVPDAKRGVIVGYLFAAVQPSLFELRLGKKETLGRAISQLLGGFNVSKATHWTVPKLLSFAALCHRFRATAPPLAPLAGKLPRRG